MKLAPVLNQQFQQRLAAVSPNAELLAFNQDNQSKLEQQLLPEKFSETWKYTSLRPLEAGHLSAYSAPAAIDESQLPRFSDQRLIIVNGYLPNSLPHYSGIDIKALTGKTDSTLSNTTFAYFNGASLTQGLEITVPDHYSHEALLHIIFYSTGASVAHHNTRLHIRVGRNSQLNIVEHYIGQGSQLCNAVTEIYVGENSRLNHCRLQSEAASCLHIGQLSIEQQRSSQVNSFQFTNANQLKRNDVHILLKGEGSELNMYGAFVARGQGHVDNQICVEHYVPHCVSTQSYKGIAGDQGQAIFNGRIHILPGASKTNADLSNKNLLLNVGAEINSKPELEIYNDDVKCSHGTTVGQIDPAMRFYLQSRGISESDAQRMLSLGFIKQELSHLPFENLAQWIEQWLGGEVTEAL